MHNVHGSVKGLSYVLHVPTVTRNLIFVGQMVEKGLQVSYTQKGCFVEDPHNVLKLVAKGKKEGRLFTEEVKSF